MSSLSVLPLNILVVTLQVWGVTARYTPIREAISGAKPAPQAVRGDTSNRNEKSDILALCLLVGGVLFRPLAIRHGVSPGHRGCDTPGSQKAPSAIKCIKNWPPGGYPAST